MNRFLAPLQALVAGGVDFILIGGVAATAHGSVRLTFDVDVVYGRSPENVRRLVACMAPHHPYLRGAPPGLPFRFDEKTILAGLNFTFTTDIGDIDFLGEVAGGGTYPELLPDSIPIPIHGLAVPCVSLPTLIRLKRAAGRRKDLEAVAELEAIQEEMGPPGPAAER